MWLVPAGGADQHALPTLRESIVTIGEPGSALSASDSSPRKDANASPSARVGLSGLLRLRASTSGSKSILMPATPVLATCCAAAAMSSGRLGALNILRSAWISPGGPISG